MGSPRNKTKQPKQEQHGDNKPKKPYGFVLVLRALASAAIRLHDRPAALRVLCVVAEYMGQDGKCKISQDTVAARLGTSRQAVNAHLAVLDKMEILVGEASKDGVLKSYSIDMEGLEDERFKQKQVDQRRAAKREAKKRKPNSEQVKPKTEPRVWTRAEPKDGDTVRHPKYGVGRVDDLLCGPDIFVRFRHGTHVVRANSLMVAAVQPTPDETPATNAIDNDPWRRAGQGTGIIQ
jgi:hypothetical protein